MNLTQKRVNLDGIVEDVPALVADVTWNGFAVPFFTREQAERVVEALQNLPNPYGEESRLEWVGDVVIEVYPHDDGVEVCRPLTIGGVKYWALGGFSWTWSTKEA